ncbi:MAG TPA: hypothetical protein VGC76_15370 [Pyrinomonadaceae bacterium]|jgi:hypothetical protein
MKEMTFDDIETAAAAPFTIGEAWSNLLRNPSLFIRHWNYKGAILSGVLRAPIFLLTYLIGKESVRLAVGAALLQFVFRFLFAGLSGALIQGFRRVEPAWKALLSILLVVPLISHLFEFLIQTGFAYFTNTHDHTDEAIIRSICVSLISALFSLFIMRRNVMIVGEAGSKSLFSDVARLPILMVRFLSFIPLELAAMLRRKEIIAPIAGVFGFGIFSQMMCWAVTNRAFWTYNGGRDIPFVKFWGVDGVILLVLAIGLAIIYLARTSRED